MSAQPDPADRRSDNRLIVAAITRLAQTASVEVNVQDERLLADSRASLPVNTKLYVSHLPGQTWDATIAMCGAVRRAGYEPIPHLPVRLVESADRLEHILGELAATSRPRGILVIAGDYSTPAGPYSQAVQLIQSGALQRHGFTDVSVAGHPEGHPKVDGKEIRRAEIEKTAVAASLGLQTTVLTQFLFEPEPFIQWANDLQSSHVTAQLVCGLAGPARITTLLRYAARCGVGASIRALSARPTSMMALLGDHGPERPLRALAEARLANRCKFAGAHVFSFGGFARTVEWLARVAAGEITLTADGGFVA